MPSMDRWRNRNETRRSPMSRGNWMKPTACSSTTSKACPKSTLRVRRAFGIVCGSTPTAITQCTPGRYGNGETTKKCPFHIRIHHLIPILRVRFQQGAAQQISPDRGIVDQDVSMPEGLHHVLSHGLRTDLVSHIQTDPKRPARRLEAESRLLNRSTVDITEDNMCAVLEEELGIVEA